jgi:hypothetical protein
VTAIWIVPGAAAMPTAIVAGVIVYTLAVKLIRPLPADDLRKLEAMTEVFPRPLQVAGKAFLKWLWR